MKVASNTAAAEAAVSGFASIEIDGPGQQVSLGPSNIAGMQAGANVANEILNAIQELVTGVQGQASSVTALAVAIEDRDRSDAAGLGGAA